MHSRHETTDPPNLPSCRGTPIFFHLSLTGVQPDTFQVPLLLWLLCCSCRQCWWARARWVEWHQSGNCSGWTRMWFTTQSSRHHSWDEMRDFGMVLQRAPVQGQRVHGFEHG